MVVDRGSVKGVTWSTGLVAGEFDPDEERPDRTPLVGNEDTDDWGLADDGIGVSSPDGGEDTYETESNDDDAGVS